MKHNRFIELLNLYLDGEIDDTEKQLLDEALQKSAEFRAIFEQYTKLQNASLVATEKFKPQMRKSVDFHKYAELARNADSRIFTGYAYTGAALLLVGVLLVSAFRFVGDSVLEAVFDTGGEEVAQAQTFRLDDFPGANMTREDTVVQAAFDENIVSQDTLLGAFSERAMNRFQAQWDQIKSGTELEQPPSDRTSFFGNPFMGTQSSYGEAAEDFTLANFRFQR